jgi:hypothetical protein
MAVVAFGRAINSTNENIVKNAVPRQHWRGVSDVSLVAFDCMAASRYVCIGSIASIPACPRRVRLASDSGMPVWVAPIHAPLAAPRRPPAPQGLRARGPEPAAVTTAAKTLAEATLSGL